MITSTRTPALTARPAFTVKTLLDRLLVLASIRRERAALAEMDAQRLADVGLSPRAARREARRLAWDAPERWLR